MKISHLSTFWPNRFGHTHYTDNLIAGMRTHRPEQHVVLAEHGSNPSETEAHLAVPCFRRTEDYVEGIVAATRQHKPDVMIIQYSNDLFGEDNRFPRLLEALAAEGVRTVVNCHSVYPRRWRCGYKPERTIEAFDRAVAKHAAAIHVHTNTMRRDLGARDVDVNKVHVIPHGSKAIEARDPVASKAELGIPADAKVVLFFGFVWLGKGIDFLLDVFARVQKQVPEAFLYVGGHTRRNLWSFYMKYLRARIRLLGIHKRTLLWGSYVPDSAVPTVYSAGDVVAMPYRQDYSSVSGVVHQTAGIGKLMLCSRIAKFDEVTDHVSPELTVGARDIDAWVSTTVRLLTDPAFAEDMRAKIKRFGEQTAWPVVGKQHLDLCDRLMAAR